MNNQTYDQNQSIIEQLKTVINDYIEQSQLIINDENVFKTQILTELIHNNEDDYQANAIFVLKHEITINEDDENYDENYDTLENYNVEQISNLINLIVPHTIFPKLIANQFDYPQNRDLISTRLYQLKMNDNIFTLLVTPGYFYTYINLTIGINYAS